MNLICTGGTPPYSYNWDNSDTTSLIDQLAIGTYQLLITDQNECKFDTLIQISMTTSIKDLGETSPLHFFPNPNQGSFTIENRAFSPIIHAQLFSTTGALIKPAFPIERASEGLYHVELPGLNNVNYFLLMISNDKIYAIRFTVLK